MRMPEIGVNTYSYIQTCLAEQAVERLAQAGFRAFECMAHPGHLWPEELSQGERVRIAAHIAALGARIITLSIPNIDLNIASTFPDVRAASIHRLSTLIDLASDLGAESIVMSPGKANPIFPAPVQELSGHFHDALAILCRRAATRDIKILVENVPTSFLPDAVSLMRAIDDYGEPAIGVVYDLANSYFISEDCSAALNRIGPRLKLLHVAETGKDRYRRAPLTHGGSVPWASLPELLEAGCCPIMLEIASARPDEDHASSLALLSGLDWERHRK